MRRVSNLGRTIRFVLDGDMELSRRLVSTPVRDPAAEVNALSPVGRALLDAAPGEERVAVSPAGHTVVKVLEVL